MLTSENIDPKTTSIY